MDRSFFEQRYAELKPARFISLSEQINQLYDGPWVQLGSSPEEGTNNPNPIDQEKARRLWRNAYKKLKPYEKFIYEDYENLSKDRNMMSGFDSDYRAICAMYDLCESYHNIVEIWDEMLADKENLEDTEIVFEAHEIVPYDPDRAMIFLAQKQVLFKKTYWPKAVDRLKRWWSRIPEEKREDAIKIKLTEYEDDLRKSGFLDYYFANLTPGFMEEILPLADNGAMAERILSDERFACVMDDLHDGIDVLNIEKLEKYVWEQQKYLMDEQLFSFLLQEEMKQYLPKLLHTPMSKVKEFLESLMVSLEFDPITASPTLHFGISSDKPKDSSTHSSLVAIQQSLRQIEPNPLPPYFVSELQFNKEASDTLKRCLMEINPRVNVAKGNRSEKWKWPHVKEALILLKLVDEKINPTDFGEAINALLPERSAASVKQSFKYGRINPDFPNVTDKSIIAEIVKMLQPVKVLMK